MYLQISNRVMYLGRRPHILKKLVRNISWTYFPSVSLSNCGTAYVVLALDTLFPRVISNRYILYENRLPLCSAAFIIQSSFIHLTNERYARLPDYNTNISFCRKATAVALKQNSPGLIYLPTYAEPVGTVGVYI